MKLLLIITLITFSVSAQEIAIEMPFSLSLYNKCFDDLKPIQFATDDPSLKNLDACNLITCSELLSIKEVGAIAALKYRITEIARKLFENGTPIKLIYGPDSSEISDKRNENLKDDNGIVYISIATSDPTAEEKMTSDLVNTETDRLLLSK